MIQASTNGRQETPTLASNLWAFLGLTTITLILSSGITPGNTLGQDEWAYIDTILDKHSLIFFGNRPAELIYQSLVFRTLGIHPIAVHTSLILFRISAAFVLYLILRIYSSPDSWFPLGAAVLYLAHRVDDFFLMLPVFLLHRTGTLLLVLLAVYTLIRYLRSARFVWLVMGTILATVAILSYEATLPLLAGVPLLLLIAERRNLRRSRIGIVVWYLAIGATAAHYALPLLGLSRSTYASGMLEPFAPVRILERTLLQLRNLYDPITQATTADLSRNPIPGLFTGGLSVAVLLVAHGQMLHPRHLPGKNNNQQVATWFFWLGIGLVVSWLGFAVFLLTGLADAITHVHPFSVAGAGIALASLACLVGSLWPKNVYRSYVTSLIAGLFIAFGSTRTAIWQARLRDWEANWRNQAVFVRSLAHQAPGLRENTLIVYIEDPHLNEAPFAAGFGFQYAMVYLYDDMAVGLIPTDQLLYHNWSVNDSGVQITPEQWMVDIRFPSLHQALHRWNEIMFVTRMPDGRIRILDQIPAEFYTPQRQAQYNPYARVELGFVNSRIRELLPPIQSVQPILLPH